MSVCFLDIETTGFSSKTDKIFVVCCASSSSSRVHSFHGDERTMILSAYRHISSFKSVATWNGAAFDIPFMTKRAKMYGIRLKIDNHIDMQRVAARSLPEVRLTLDNVAKIFKINAQKSPFSNEIWKSARSGDADSIKYIIDHCKKDVLVLKQLWPFIME